MPKVESNRRASRTLDKTESKRTAVRSRARRSTNVQRVVIGIKEMQDRHGDNPFPLGELLAAAEDFTLRIHDTPGKLFERYQKKGIEQQKCLGHLEDVLDKDEDLEDQMLRVTPRGRRKIQTGREDAAKAQSERELKAKKRKSSRREENEDLSLSKYLKNCMITSDLASELREVCEERDLLKERIAVLNRSIAKNIGTGNSTGLSTCGSITFVGNDADNPFAIAMSSSCAEECRQMQQCPTPLSSCSTSPSPSFSRSSSPTPSSLRQDSSPSSRSSAMDIDSDPITIPTDHLPNVTPEELATVEESVHGLESALREAEGARNTLGSDLEAISAAERTYQAELYRTQWRVQELKAGILALHNQVLQLQTLTASLQAENANLHEQLSAFRDRVGVRLAHYLRMAWDLFRARKEIKRQNSEAAVLMQQRESAEKVSAEHTKELKEAAATARRLSYELQTTQSMKTKLANEIQEKDDKIEQLRKVLQRDRMKFSGLQSLCAKMATEASMMTLTPLEEEDIVT